MRIKKINETTPTMASVVDGYSTSTQDGYSCDYSNEHFGGTVLYSNDSGTTGNITISDNFTDYNRVDLIVSCADGYSDYGANVITIYPKILSKWKIETAEYGGYWGLVNYEIITINNNTITRGDNHYFAASKPDNYVIQATWNKKNDYRSKIYKVIGYK